MKKLRNIQKNNVDNNKTNSKFFVSGKEFFAKFFCNKYFITLKFRLIVAFIDSIEIARITTLGAIVNISAVLEEIVASTNTVNQTVGEQLLSVESLNKSAGSLDNNAVVLVEAVDKFKV